MTDTSYKYEVGKWYKLRNGMDVLIQDDNCKALGELSGTVYDVGRTAQFDVFTRWFHKDGRYVGGESDFDIVPHVRAKDFWVDVHIAGKRRIFLLKITNEGDELIITKVEHGNKQNSNIREGNERMSDDVVVRYTSARAIEAPALLLKDAIDEVKKLRVETARLRRLVFHAFQEGFNSGPGKHDESGTSDNDLAEAWDLSEARAAIREGGEE